MRRCCAMRDQATFHPLKYLHGVGCRDRGQGRAAVRRQRRHEDRGDGKQRALITTDGGSVTADHAVFATNSPINDRVASAQQDGAVPHLCDGLHLPRGTLPDALYWDMADPYHYVRLNPGPARPTI